MITPLLLSFLSGSAEAGLFRRSRAPVSICEDVAEDVIDAAHPEQVRERTRQWLSCVARSGKPPLDLDDQLSDLIRHNPYDAVEREVLEIIRGFTDRSLLRELPETPRETEAYMQMLRDQALYARARGDQPFAEAASAREASIANLQSLIQQLD